MESRLTFINLTAVFCKNNISVDLMRMITFKNNSSSLFQMLCFIMLMFLLSFEASAQDMTLLIRTVNDRSGADVPADIKVNDLKTGNPIKTRIESGGVSVKVGKGQKIRISATSEGYYPEEKNFDTENENTDEIVVRLSSRPSAVLVFRAFEEATKAPVEAEVIIYFKEKQLITIPVTRKIEEYRIPLSESGNYKIAGKSKGLAQEITELEVNVTDPPNIFMLNLAFKPETTRSVLSFTDKSHGSQLIGGAVTIVRKKDGQILQEGNIKEGKFSVVSGRDELLEVRVKADRYADLKVEMRNSGQPRVFELSPSTFVETDVFDSETGKRLVADLQVKSPSGKIAKLKTTDRESVIFIPEETGSFMVESSVKGYVTRSANFTVLSLSGGSMLFSMKLEKVQEDYVISVFDSESKAQLRQAKVRIFDEGGQEVNAGGNTGKPVIDHGKKYTFEVVAEGYETYTANMGSNRKIDVFLRKKANPEYYFAVMNSENGKPVPNARFRVYDLKGAPVPSAFDPKLEKFMAKIPSPGMYSVEASSEGYLNFKGNVNISTNKEVTVTLSPVSGEVYTFHVRDLFTREDLSAEARLNANGKNVPLEKTSESHILKATIMPMINYEIEISRTGYKPYKRKVTPDGLRNGTFFLEMEKDFYRLEYFITNVLSPEEEKTVVITAETPGAAPQKLQAEGKPVVYWGKFVYGKTYDIAVNVEGFLPYKTTLEVVRKEYLKIMTTVLLTRIIKEEKKMPEAIPVSQEVVDFPEQESLLDQEFSAPTVLGKTYRLNNVNFEKTKPRILEGSATQLDLLAKGLEKYKNIQIEVIGHTDGDGDDKRLNQYLSEFRAKVIASYLFNKGIDDKRIVTRGKGSAEPLAPNDNDENKARNRRVEVRITGI